MDERKKIKLKADAEWCTQALLRVAGGTLFASVYPIIICGEVARELKNERHVHGKITLRNGISTTFEVTREGLRNMFVELPRLVFEDMDKYGSARALAEYDAKQKRR